MRAMAPLDAATQQSSVALQQEVRALAEVHHAGDLRALVQAYSLPGLQLAISHFILLHVNLQHCEITEYVAKKPLE